MFDRLIVSILRNETKEPLFSVEERMEMLREVVHVYPNVEVDSFDGLLVDHAAAHSATVLLRGIRAISDYEYELQMALMNRRLRPGNRNGLHDGQRSLFVHQLPPGEGSLRPGREHHRTGAARGGSAAAPPAVQNQTERGLDHKGMQAVINRISRTYLFHQRVFHHESGGGRRKASRRRAWTWWISGPASRISPRPINIKRAAIRAMEQNFTKYTPRGRHRRAEEGRLRPPRAGFRHRLPAQRVPHHGGRQARHLQPDAGAGQPRRRGRHPRAVLGDVSRTSSTTPAASASSPIPTRSRASRSRPR